ncbi:TetR/AcrR family transcriptional regulator [Paenibacillus sp. 1P07SE]|uniref:TetR/AcrR family transcriptional regulator n=1 Tax=Paenibacillus sp. 1P07SE TaxID=3132209 RepID=UPI0039A58D18
MITTKDEMCETAIQMFRAQGYENVSINMICHRLQVTRGSFYHHFQSKNDLLLHWFSSQVKQQIQLETDWDQPKQSLKTHALDYAHIIEHVGHDFMYHILLAEFELHGQHFHTYLEAAGQSIALIEEAMASGDIHAAQPPEELLAAFTAGVIGVIVLWKLESGTFDIVKKIESIFEVSYR